MSPLPLFSTQLGSSGPRVVFLHGIFGQGKNWTGIAKGLQDEARVTLLDLPNHGRSAWTDDFSYVAMADRVADLLAVQGGGEPYVVVGHSMGGKTAMLLALRHPELVERLCVVDVSPAPTGEVSAFAGYIAGMQAVDLHRLPDRDAAATALEPSVPDPVVRGFLLQNLRRGPSAADPTTAWHWQPNLALFARHLDDVGGWPELDTETYAGPVLWLAGADSGYVQPAYAPGMRALFPRVQLVTVKGAGHWVHADQPAVFLSIIRQFVRGAAGGASSEPSGVES